MTETVLQELLIEDSKRLFGVDYDESEPISEQNRLPVLLTDADGQSARLKAFSQRPWEKDYIEDADGSVRLAPFMNVFISSQTTRTRRYDDQPDVRRVAEVFIVFMTCDEVDPGSREVTRVCGHMSGMHLCEMLDLRFRRDPLLAPHFVCLADETEKYYENLVAMEPYYGCAMKLVFELPNATPESVYI